MSKKEICTKCGVGHINVFNNHRVNHPYGTKSKSRAKHFKTVFKCNNPDCRDKLVVRE